MTHSWLRGLGVRGCCSVVLATAPLGVLLPACSGDETTTDSPADTGDNSDTGVADSTKPDTAKPDTGTADTGIADTFVADTTDATKPDTTDAADTTDTADTADTADTTDTADTADTADTFVADTTDAAEAGDTGCVAPGYGTVTGTIYYSRLAASTTADGEIWVAKGDGTSDVKLTTGVWPRLSPDGKYLVFHKDNPIQTRGNIYVRDLTSGVETKVFNNGDYVVGVTWAADSTKVYFDNSCGVSVTGKDGTGFANILGRDCYDDSPDLRASDSLIAFHNVHSNMFTMKTDGSAVTAIPSTVAGDVWPRWSPTGAKLSFLHVNAESDPRGNLGVINADGSGRKILTALGSPADGFLSGSGTWTADGNTLVAGGVVCGVNGMWAVNATTGVITRLHTSDSTTMPTVEFVGEVR